MDIALVIHTLFMRSHEVTMTTMYPAHPERTSSNDVLNRPEQNQKNKGKLKRNPAERVATHGDILFRVATNGFRIAIYICNR